MGLIPNQTTFATAIVNKNICMPRYQRDWINAHYSINLSGLVQEMTLELIKQTDPEYYEKVKNHAKHSLIQRREFIEVIIKNHPDIIPTIAQ